MSSSWATWLVAILVVTAGITVLLLFVVVPAWVPNAPNVATRHELSAETAVRNTVLQTLAGLIVLAGLGFTARTVHLSRETHVTDRLTKAVDQLGDKEPVVRIGGLYALQRLARNAPGDADMIRAVLTDYLRVHAGGAQGSANQALAGPDIETAVRVLVALR